MLFSEVLGSMVRAGESWTVQVPPDWMQGRSVFGGLQSALAFRAMRALVPEMPLRVLQTTFIAPMGGGVTIIRARILRAGKSTVHVEARVLEGESVLTIVLGVFGRARPSLVSVTPRPAPSRSPAAVHDPFVDRPAFLQHFETDWLVGGPPGSGVVAPEAVVNVSLLDQGKLSEEHVIAIADATPPIALSMMKTSAFGSSLTWTLEMLWDGAFADLPLSGWRLDVDLVAGGGGYTSQSEIVWGPSVGESGAQPVAISRQCMVVFG